MSEHLKTLFEGLNLNAEVVTNALKNKKLSTNLEACIKEAKVENGCEASIGKLIYDVATNLKPTNTNAVNNRPNLLAYIVAKKIDSVPKLNAAIKYCNANEKFNPSVFEQTCGVGVTVTEKDIIKVIESVIEDNRSEFASKGKALYGPLIGQVNKALPFADGKVRKKLFDERFDAALKDSGWNPKNQSSTKKSPKKSPKKKPKTSNTEEVKSSDDGLEDVETMEKWLKGRELPEAQNSRDMIAKRSKNVKNGKFLTRFPPEPNGFLHIGHCKAMTFNFTLAEEKRGDCYLRFDDTNPAAEEQVYIDNIIENVKWMGFEPWQITYSSDYFEELYQLAIKMIKDGNAYVCEQSKKEMEESRKSFRTDNPMPSPWRNRSVEENLKLFELMRYGYYEEGEVCLRMKGDITSDNPNMWDHVAFRIKYTPHPHAGDKWCIYPTYDYTHCIIDSLEWISASCCTLEFENRRESYFWLLDVLELYKPVVWEYSRLNLTYNVLSKRKLIQLVKQGYVRGWDDPRMLTINGLRRRGYTPEILRNFCDKVGVTRKSNYISPKLLEACARERLNVTSSRAMAVISPLKVVITNYPKNKSEDIECPDFPRDETRTSTHTVKFSGVVYIDRSDFREKANKKYYGLIPGKTVRLKYAYNITCTDVVRDEKGNAVELRCKYDPSTRHDLKGVRKGHLTWVCDVVPAEFRLYSPLFRTEKPGGEDWLDQLDGDSEIIERGYVDAYVANSKENAFQFERFGYFVTDSVDSKPGNLVFNRTVPLRESSDKKSMN